jgi:hypothetical protein
MKMTPDQLKEPEWLFPFEGMDIGDSFFIPTLRPADMIYAIESGARRAKIKVKCFVTAKDGCLGVTTWRKG